MCQGEAEGAGAELGSWRGKSPAALNPMGSALRGSPLFLPQLCGAVRAGTHSTKVQLLWHGLRAGEQKMMWLRLLQGQLQVLLIWCRTQGPEPGLVHSSSTAEALEHLGLQWGLTTYTQCRHLLVTSCAQHMYPTHLTLLLP